MVLQPAGMQCTFGQSTLCVMSPAVLTCSIKLPAVTLLVVVCDAFVIGLEGLVILR